LEPTADTALRATDETNITNTFFFSLCKINTNFSFNLYSNIEVLQQFCPKANADDDGPSAVDITKLMPWLQRLVPAGEILQFTGVPARLS
jgi:hypothetical protein